MASVVRRIRRAAKPVFKTYRDYEPDGMGGLVLVDVRKEQTNVGHGHKVPLFPKLDKVTRRQIRNVRKRKARAA